MKTSLLWWIGALAGGAGVSWMCALAPECGLLTLGVAVAAAGIAAGARPGRVTVRRQTDAGGKALHYTLSYGAETVVLEPGKSWPKTDLFKWVTRGLIEDPQSFQVLPSGAVEINAERIALEDPEGETKLELQINKHHPPSIAHKPPVIPVRLAELEAAQTGKVRFRVRLDHLGHIMIECTRGNEKAETGLRGLAALAQSGFLIKPGDVHVDPLQRYIELDGIRFESNPEGARRLEETLNERYAPTLKPDDSTEITVRENAASATGLDVDFVTIQAGARLHVKGHLTQEKLDLLQDSQRCDLLHPGIIIRLSPPNLLIRRRRPDGGEEPVPGLPDVSYLRMTAAQLQQILNHPLVRRRSNPGAPPPPAVPPPPTATGLERIRITHNSQNRLFLWIECIHADGKRDGKAFTHHNVAELSHRGVFRDRQDVSLSIDNHRLSILDLDTHEEQAITLSSDSSDADLARASEMLTAALRPPTIAGGAP